MRGHIDNRPLIGRDMLIELDMMILERTGNLKETNKLRIKRVRGINELKFTKLIGEYEDVSQRMRNIKEPKTGKVIEVGFEMEAEIQPVAQKPRNITLSPRVST